MCRSWAVCEGLGAWKHYFALYKQDDRFPNLEIFFAFQICKKLDQFKKPGSVSNIGTFL